MWLLRSSWRFGIAAVLILSRLQVNAEEQLHTEAVVDDAVVDGELRQRSVGKPQ